MGQTMTLQIQFKQQYRHMPHFETDAVQMNYILHYKWEINDDTHAHT